MSSAPKTPLEQHISKRGGDLDLFYQKFARARPEYKLIRIISWLVILAFVTYFAIPDRPDPIQLTYELDLKKAPTGKLVITLVAEGDLPRNLNLEFPPGVFWDLRNGVHPHSAMANELYPDGRQGKPLAVERTREGWTVGTRGVRRVGFIYHVDFNQVLGQENDVRLHISSPVAGGLRAAGFEIFLQPILPDIDDITVMLHNPDDLQILVPWPALVRSSAPVSKRPAPGPAQPANISQGQGFLPASGLAPMNDTDPDKAPSTPPVPANLMFHPQNLADLNNALLVCGDLQIVSTQVRECVIQLASDHSWNFPLDSALDMVRRIARTEMGFFGSAPTSQITVILAPNRITGEKKFDIYGVHTGSSVLVMMDPDITWEDLEDQSASVIAHEMFHGWLGEAIPQRDPDMLWFTEGATTWYAARMLTAASIWSPDHARAVLEARLERDYKENSLKNQISVAEAAADVMAKPDKVRFAYAGGVIACMNLDQWLAEQTGKRRPLDQILRHLYENRDGSHLTRLAFETAVLEVTGIDCSVWLDEHVYTKSILPTTVRLI